MQSADVGLAGRSPFDSQLYLSAQRAIASAERSPSDRLARCAERVLVALNDQRLDLALRQIDREWRTTEEDSQAVAAIYARLMMMDGRHPAAALGLLQRVSTPDPDLAALTAHALFLLDRQAEASHTLNRALMEFCVAPDDLLAHVASQMVQASGLRVAGWVGRSANLDFIGELTGESAPNALQVRLGNGAQFIQPIRAHKNQRLHGFKFTLREVSPALTVEMSCNGLPLLGSGGTMTPPFGVDGRTSAAGRLVQGWARISWQAQQPVELQIEDEHGERMVVATLDAETLYRWPFRLDLTHTALTGKRLDIAAVLADGTVQALPDSPLLLDGGVRATAKRPPKLSRWKPTTSRQSAGAPPFPGVYVIIPVYRGHDESLACIHAALATAGTARVVVVNDATEDSRLAAALDALAAGGRITLLTNETNLGFVASVNRGMDVSPRHDVVLLNADTVVFEGWLEGLQRAAYVSAKVGTVTPLTNSGTIASYPSFAEGLMTPDAAAALHQLTRKVHAGVGAEIPVGVGFCLYIRRDCLNDVGAFDADAFGKGYGEETDFCLRARQQGWSHHLAADVFVYHAGGGSFGSRRDALLERARRLVNLRHPGYDDFIADFIQQDPLHVLRRALDGQRLAAFQGRFVLLVSLALTGGVVRFVDERCRDIRAQGLYPLILRPCVPGESDRCELWTDALDVPNLKYAIPDELDALKSFLMARSIDAIEIQHFIHLHPSVIDMVRSLGPYEVMVHDYAWICPRVTLTDGSGRYCGEPALEVCEACQKQNGSDLEEDLSVAELRTRSERWLGDARRVTAPSADTATRLRRYIEREIEVQGHAIAQPLLVPPTPRSRDDAITRIAFIGAIGEQKGYQVLLACARDAQVRALPLEFVVIGYTDDDVPLLETGKVFVTGRYREGEAEHLLRRERPDVVFMSSVWPETWCYALDIALHSGLPVVAFDMGAVAERLRAAGTGTFLPMDSTPATINNQLMEHAAYTSAARQSKMDLVQETEEKLTDRPAAATPAQPDAYIASVQFVPLPAGLYIFSVRSSAESLSPANGHLKLPALHVGLGPGVRASQVEFIAGPSTEGAWLFAKDDCLVAKVSGNGVTLVLTSVRGPGGEALAVVVERLDNRTHAAPPAVAAAAQNPAVAPPNELPAVATARNGAATAPNTVSNGTFPVEVTAHVRSRGDMTFAGNAWAGRIEPGLWIESFALRPTSPFKAQDIEYKGLTGSGFETPWLSEGAMCGTKGMSVPMAGFAIRLKMSKEMAAFDCEYSGYFKSGVVVGPMRNGAPCRSTVANDPLEGMLVVIRERNANAATALVLTPDAAAAAPRPAVTGPSFGRYRNDENAEDTPATDVTATTDPPAPKRPAKSASKNSGGGSTRSSPRR